MLYLYFIFWTLGGQLLGSLPFIFYIFSVHLCQDFLCLPFMSSIYGLYTYMCTCYLHI